MGEDTFSGCFDLRSFRLCRTRAALRCNENSRASKGTFVLEAQTLKEARNDKSRKGLVKL